MKLHLKVEQSKNIDLICMFKDQETLYSYTRFIYPSEFNTQVVLIDHPNDNDTCFVPSRIAKTNHSRQPKVVRLGSDFHFSDLEINLRPTDTYTLIQEDSVLKIETQSDEHLLYSKWIATISKDKLCPLKSTTSTREVHY